MFIKLNIKPKLANVYVHVCVYKWMPNTERAYLYVHDLLFEEYERIFFQNFKRAAIFSEPYCR